MKALSLSIALLALYSNYLCAQDKQDSLEEYISGNKKEFYKLESDKVDASSNVLRDSWISPVMLNYSYGVSEAYDTESITKKTSITIDQPIFQSGGIYFGIKYAEATRLYSQYSVDVAKRKIIKDALSLLIQIKQSEMRIQKQKLLIENAEINLAQKKESYLNGQLDSGFLNSAIIDKNVVIQALYDVETNKERLISKFRVISDMDHDSAILPHLEIIQKDEFMANNLSFKQSQSLSEKNRYFKSTTISKYLPKVSIYGGYNWDRTENFAFQAGSVSGSRATDYVSYGLKASMPLNISTFDDIQSAKVEYLESKIEELDKKKEINALFEQVMQNLESLERKRILSVENTELYGELLAETQELYEAGYKTKYDVELLRNSLEVQKNDIDIYELDRQLELLTLYEMYKNDI
ncbi:MAG: TolC family protein [Sulfurimonas sp.]|jgi:outer membrane protein TolC